MVTIFPTRAIPRGRLLKRLLWAAGLAFLYGVFISPKSTPKETPEIRTHGVMEYVKRSDKLLDVQRHDFLQVRMGRDERDDLLGHVVRDGIMDYWERFQKPYIIGSDTAHMDQQSLLHAIDQLLTLNGWVAALCPTLTRPFGGVQDSAYDDLARANNLYFIGIVIHSADHFLVDQLAVIVQMAKRLGPQNLFVSMLDYSSSDSTETLTDLCEAVLTLLGVPFRIRRVSGMTEDPDSAYYPLEESHTRNLALEPLHELYKKRKIKFHRVVWLKGFTCPNDILETIKVSQANDAAMVCGMDWAENNGFFIFSDRWRTRDILGDQFRQSRSSSKPEAGPPRDKMGAARYAQHLPFQVFCCESGTHVVDPAQSYYEGIRYRAGEQFHNLSTTNPMPVRDYTAPCLDSSQAHFCRDLWINAARKGMKDDQSRFGAAPNEGWGQYDNQVNDAPKHRVKRSDTQEEAQHVRRQDQQEQQADIEVDDSAARAKQALHDEDTEANAGSDFDAMPDSGTPEVDFGDNMARLSIPNSVFNPARILVNPRCVTTYAGVSHTQLALDLFGGEKEDVITLGNSKYVLDDWDGAPESFVCQEQRQTGGRKATKTQRRLEFSVHDELER